MGKDHSPHRWFPAWRAHPSPADTDPADLGTAFGLDLSLNEMADEPRPTPAAARRPGWMSRLTARRKPAA